jgi:hypothetical protein
VNFSALTSARCSVSEWRLPWAKVNRIALTLLTTVLRLCPALSAAIGNSLLDLTRRSFAAPEGYVAWRKFAPDNNLGLGR